MILQTDLETLIHKTLVVKLRKDPPHTLHEFQVHRLVIILEINPPPRPPHNLLPLLHIPINQKARMNNEMCDNDSNSRIKKLRNENQKPSSPRDNAPALLVVLIDPQFQYFLTLLNVEAAVDLVLDGQAVAVPAEAASNVIAVHGLVAGYNVLYGAGEDVAVVREPRGERRTVIEDVLGLVLGALQLGLECLYLRPQLEDLLLVFGEGEILPFAYFVHGGSGNS